MIKSAILVLATLSSYACQAELKQYNYSPTEPLAKITEKVYFDFITPSIGNGRIIVGLYGDVVPKTVANFVGLANGHKFKDGRTGGYEMTIIN